MRPQKSRLFVFTNQRGGGDTVVLKRIFIYHSQTINKDWDWRVDVLRGGSNWRLLTRQGRSSSSWSPCLALIWITVHLYITLGHPCTRIFTYVQSVLSIFKKQEYNESWTLILRHTVWGGITEGKELRKCTNYFSFLWKVKLVQTGILSIVSF